MFRRTKADLDRVAQMIAAGASGEDVANRLTLEGMPRQRAEWLVRTAKRDRRLFRLDNRRRELDWDPRGIVPEELAAPPPRNARIAKKATPALLLLLVFGVGALALGVWQVDGMIKLRHEGIETHGRVLSGKLTMLFTLIRYAYATSAGTINDESIVPWSVFARLNDGDAITVTYLGRRSRPFARRQLDAFLIAKVTGFQIGGGLFLLLYAPFFWRTANRQTRIDLDLARNGAVAVGEVLGFRSFFRVRYRFDGVEGEASIRTPPSVRPQPGDRIVVVYDPADPGRNLPADSLNVEFT